MADKTAPKSQLRLEWVYGYRGHQCRNNLFYNAAREVVYFVAGVGVVYNVHDKKQKFFLGHNDDILSLAIHPDKNLVATGQIGKDPYICVWDSSDVRTVSLLQNGHTHGVCVVNFDASGTKLVSVGMDGHSTVNIWDWKKGKILATTRGHTDRILDCQFHPFEENSLVSCGIKHIKFWSHSGNTLSSKKGVFGKMGDIQTVTCLVFSPTLTYSGTMSGDVYAWSGNNLQEAIPAHKGPVYTLYKSEEGYATAGKDGAVKLWDLEFALITTLDLHNTSIGYPGLCIRSVCWNNEKVLIGTQNSEIFELNPRNRSTPTTYVQGHSEGELWALAVHPKKQMFVTGSDDMTVRVWNCSDRQLIVKRKLERAIRSCAVNPEGTYIAAGFTDGAFIVLNIKDLSEVHRSHDRKEVVHEMKYSPDGQLLAVGSNDNFVDVYSISQKYKRVAVCSGNSSFITHLDWSEDSKYIQTNSGAAERLIFTASTGKQVTGKEEIRGIRWATWTGVLGPEVAGIWEKYTDTNDVNAVDSHYPEEVVVTGDDFGLVKLFRFPSLKKGARFRRYVGHSAHVTNVRFTADRSRVISTGGADHAIFQWRFIPASLARDGDDIQQLSNAYVDSNSEGSDSDASDVAELDSDIEAEKQVSYARELDKSDLRLINKQVKAELAPGKKRKQAPDDRLTLQFVHGYRGYDCRNNLFYTQTGEIVYHVAALGIVYDIKKHKQRCYTQHTDDILCLCAHPLKDLAASGQVGKDPEVHIWEVETMKTVSILKGSHERGICAVDFSGDGKKLASVGLDDNHTIQIWDWKKGEALASARGHNDKIFVIKWNPHDLNKLMTVGVKHVKFWTQAGGGLTSTRGTFGSIAKLDTMLCVAHGKTAERSFTGGSSGSIFVWNVNKLERIVQAAHKGPCFAMHSLDKGFVTGGKDGNVHLYDENFERCLKTFPIRRSALNPTSRGVLMSDTPTIRACILGHGHILVGTKNGEILELDKSGPIDLLVQGHSEGEVWGLECHPSLPLACTVGDDKTLRVWDLTSQHKMVNCRVMKKAGRCCTFSPDGKAIAVGLNDGSFAVVNSENLEDIAMYHHRKEGISDIKFSPESGKYLAVASHDNFVDIYNVASSKRVGVCKGASSYITHVDWDASGKVLMVNSGAKEQLFFEAPRGHRHAIRNAQVEQMDWASWTCVLGHTCQGVWPPKCDVTDVNGATVSRDRQLIATADDFGYIKLFDYPAKGAFAKFRKYNGHSAHVTSVRWSHDDSLLVSVGGADTATMVWRRERADRSRDTSTAARGQGESDDTVTEDEEDGYDSDVHHEKSIDYSTKIYSCPIRESSGVKPHLQTKLPTQDRAVSRTAPPTTQVAKLGGGKPRSVADLVLTHIHGYRGFDARNNLHYINEGTDIVYHAAAAGIVLNPASGAQSFYLEHTDDILCLTVNQYPKYKTVAASGQIGKNPAIHLWDVNTKKTLSILQGAHTHGVCSLDFSCAGRLLLSVGLDEEHYVAVWRWQEGSLVAKAGGNSVRLFIAQFRPDSDSNFVSVGTNHVKFWSVTGSQLVAKRGILGSIPEKDNVKNQTMLSVAFASDGITYTGAMSGDVYVWKENCLTRLVSQAHDGPIFCMYTTLKDGLIVTGAKERRSMKEGGCVKLWDQEMKRCRAYQLDTGQDTDIVKSVCRIKGHLLIGTKNSEVIQITEKSGQGQVLIQGHGEGELWGLTVHPSSGRFATGSDDGTVRLWETHKQSLTSRLPIGATRSLSYSPDGELLALGMKNGEICVITVKTLKVWAKKRDHSSPVSDIRFSPDGRYLAAGFVEPCVEIYDASIVSLPRLSSCRGIPSFVIQMDFSQDSAYLRVSTGAYIHQVFSTQTGELVTDFGTKSIVWASWSSVLGDDVVGIWPEKAEKADVNCAHLANNGAALVTGDDSGLVKLFGFPCSQKNAPYTQYFGHSAHVTNVRFTYDDKHVISTGGDDSCVFVWKTQPTKLPE